MSGLSTFSAHAFLNFLRGVAMGTAPASLYVGLHTADPTDAGTTAEVTTDIRAAGRVAVTFDVPSAKAMVSDADASFGNAVSSKNVTHFSIWDAASGGNCYGTAPLTTPRSIVAGDPVKFPSGSLSVDLSKTPAP